MIVKRVLWNVTNVSAHVCVLSNDIKKSQEEEEEEERTYSEINMNLDPWRGQ